MYCGNCGMPLKDNESVCPSCNTPIEGVIEAKLIDDSTMKNSKYEEYKETEKIAEKYGFNKLLIYTILELICCSRLFGIISLVLLLVKFKPAIDQRNFEEADKSRNLVKTMLIIGLVWGILSEIAYVALQVLATIGSLSY